MITNQKGVSFVEVLMVVLITALMVAGGGLALTTGRSSWFTAEAGIQVQESLRQALDHMTAELRQTKFSKATITVGAGVNTSDNIKFSIPVICHTGDNLLDVNADVAHWGATLTWGCRTAACMDADNVCNTIDYANIQYELIAGNKLVRKVLNNVGGTVRQDTIASNISRIKANFNGTQIIHIDLTALSTSVMKRALTMTVASDVIFRNQ